MQDSDYDEEALAFSLTEEQRRIDSNRQNELVNKMINILQGQKEVISCLFERFEPLFLNSSQPIHSIMTLSIAKDNSVGAVQVGTPLLQTYGQRFYSSSKAAIRGFHSVRNKIMKKHPNIKIIWEGVSNNEKLS